MVLEEEGSLKEVLDLRLLLPSVLALEARERAFVKEQVSDLWEAVDLFDVGTDVGNLASVVHVYQRVLLVNLGFKPLHELRHYLKLRDAMGRLEEGSRLRLGEQALIKPLQRTNDLLLALSARPFSDCLDALHQALILLEA